MKITKKDKVLRRFRLLAHHRGRIERAILDSMVDLYGNEKDAEIVARLPDFMVFVVKDLTNAVRVTYEKYEALRASRSARKGGPRK